ncbi:MAG: hypothetical protein KDA20_01285 [Phycisphaerales bacterium]|nr:hypothetical protein [Phycisphaerales bacterium]
MTTPDASEKDRWLSPDEVRPVLFAAGYFFCVLSGIMVLRPLREAMGLASGDIDKIRWLFAGTAGAMLLATFVIGWLVARFRRSVFIGIAHRAMCLGLFAAWLMLQLAPEQASKQTGAAYYVFHSVMNLLVVSLFWSVAADCFTYAQSKRLFPPIAIGGTLGAICGTLITQRLTRMEGFDVRHLFLVAIGFLEIAVWLSAATARAAAKQPIDQTTRLTSTNERIIGGSAWQGVTDVAKSPYLLGIAAFPVLTSIVSTVLYFTDNRLISAESTRQMHEAIANGMSDLDAAALRHRVNTHLWATINLWGQIGTLCAQLFLTSGIIRFLGVGAALATMPIYAIGGVVGLAVSPTLTAAMWIEGGFRATERGIMKPALATLYTVVPPAQRYKAKAFIDTFITRGTDTGSAFLEGKLKALNAVWAVPAVVVPLALGATGMSWWLSAQQRKRAN